MTQRETDATRPLVLGYVRAHVLMNANELVQIKDQLRAFAQTEGFTLGDIYFEHAHTAPAAFHALTDAIVRTEACAVVVPSEWHLPKVTPPLSTAQWLERATGASLLIAQPSS